MDYEADSLHASSAEQFANFNFAQAVAKILDNLGFSSTTADALDLLTSMMRRYFEDLCQRISSNKDLGGRQLPSIGDVHVAFKTQNVSLVELSDYLRQVQNLPAPPKIPEYPIKEFDASESDLFQTRIFNADPFADEVPSLEEVEERYGKKKQEVQEEVDVSAASDEQNKMELSVTSSKIVEEDPATAFSSWSLPDNAELPNFSGLSANDLGFDMTLYKKKFAEADSKKHKLNANGAPKISNTSKLFNRLVPNSSISLKVDGLNKLVEKIKKHKKHKDKDRKKEKHREKKHREPAPTLTPVVPLPSLEPDSGIGDSLKINIGPPPKIDEKESANGAPNKTDNVKPSEPPKVNEPIKAKNLTPPPTLEQVVPKLPASDDKPLTIQQPPPNVASAEEIKVTKKKKHKRDKEKSRKRKHDEISNTLPPVLEPSVSQVSMPPALPATTFREEADSAKEPAVIQQQPVDEPPKSAGPTGVRLKIRIGSTLSSDSMKSSPVETTASKPPSAGITPPALTKEAIEEPPMVEKPVPDLVSDEPPPKKHKKEKKHKRDKDREKQFETEEQKAEYERQKKERKEKKLREKSNGHSNNNEPSSSDHPKTEVVEQPKKEKVAPSVHEPLKLKLNKNGGLEKQESSEKEQQIKAILSMSTEGKEKKEHSEKSESKDKSHKVKKNKKEKKHKKDREFRPASSHSQIAESSEKPKPKELPKMLNQFTRPSSQNSTLPKLFDPTPFKPEVKKDKNLTMKPPKPAQTANTSSGSSTGSKPKKKDKAGKSSEAIYICPKCSIAYVEGAADMIGCDTCDKWFHFVCVGMIQPPADDEPWFCQKCVEAKRKAKNRKK